MTMAQILSFIGVIVTIISLVSVVGWRFHSKIDSNSQLCEKARGRIYERIDDVKKYNEDKFVDTKICDLRHENTDRQLREITAQLAILSSDVKKLLTKNGLT